MTTYTDNKGANWTACGISESCAMSGSVHENLESKKINKNKYKTTTLNCRESKYRAKMIMNIAKLLAFSTRDKKGGGGQRCVFAVSSLHLSVTPDNPHNDCLPGRPIGRDLRIILRGQSTYIPPPGSECWEGMSRTSILWWWDRIKFHGYGQRKRVAWNVCNIFRGGSRGNDEECKLFH